MIGSIIYLFFFFCHTNTCSWCLWDVENYNFYLSLYFRGFKYLVYWEDKPSIEPDVSPTFTAAGIFSETSNYNFNSNYKKIQRRRADNVLNSLEQTQKRRTMGTLKFLRNLNIYIYIRCLNP